MTYRCDNCNSKNDPCDCDDNIHKIENYDLLEQQIDQLQEDKKKLEYQLDLKLYSRRKLKSDNKKLIEALEFYADSVNWQKGLECYECITDEDVSAVKETNGLYSVGGKLARKVLKEIKR